MVRPALLLCLVAVLGCSAHHQARSLFEKGDYLGAVERYDEILAKTPNDFEALGGRLESRERALAGLISAAEKAHASGDRAARSTALASALEYRAKWSHTLAEAPRLRLQALVEGTGSELEQRVGEKLVARRPLEADSLLAGERRLLATAEFAPLRVRLAASVHELAAQRCGELSAGASPYFLEAVRRYCRSLEVTLASAPELPMQRSDLAIEPRLEGAPPALQQAWEAAWSERVQRELRSSVWFAERAPVAAGSLVTRYQGRDEARPVHRARPWTENVPYTVFETRSEPHQVPYTEMESYTEQVPYTAQESYTYSCGDYRSPRTCTGSRSVTRYRSETRTRPVTRYRTEYRSRSVPVTHHRQEPRSFEYDAVERAVDYRAQVTARFDLGLEEKPLAVSLESALAKTLDEHQVTFETAEVAPQPRVLPTQEQWVATTLDAFAARLKVALAQHWSDSFCAPPTSELEAAARCAYGAPSVPDAAMTMLVAALADDPARIREVLTATRAR